VFELVGGFDEALSGRCADVDLSWRARAAGVPVRVCPRALFLAPADDRPRDPAELGALTASAVVLARKWGAAEFEDAMTRDLARLGARPPELRPASVPQDWRGVADFRHHLDFAPVRW
jgi:hypothetical protein